MMAEVLIQQTPRYILRAPISLFLCITRQCTGADRLLNDMCVWLWYGGEAMFSNV